MNDLVSVIIPNYNGDRFIERCIQSVISQSYENWEMIVVDDCSMDSSKDLIQKYVEELDQITAIFLEENSGPAVARNKGIELAKGRFIAFLDNDDYWLPEKLKVQVDFMKRNNRALSFSSYQSTDEDGNDEKLIIAQSQISYTKLLTTNYIGCLTAMYDANYLGKRYFPLIKKRQDWALWLSITREGVVAQGIKESLAVYTRREASVSSNKFGLLKYNWKVYRDLEHISFFKSLYLISLLVGKKIFR